MKLAHYRKTIIALVGGVLSWAQVAYVPDGHIDRPEWYGLAVVFAVAFGVYGVPNKVPDEPPVDVPVDSSWGPVDVPADPAADAVPVDVPADPAVDTAPGVIV